MRIGIKYCGGCNPRYDRSAFVSRLKAALPDLDFQPVRIGEVYDLLLVVSGCRVECADIQGIQYRLGKLGVYDDQQLEPLVDKIKSYVK